MRLPDTLCLIDRSDNARIVHLVSPQDNFDKVLGAHRAGLFEIAGEPAPGRLYLVPGPQGVDRAVFVVDAAEKDAARFGSLATGLLRGDWSMNVSDRLRAERAGLEGEVLLGFCMGAYRYAVGPECLFPVRLVVPAEHAKERHIAQAVWLGRDLVNMPANLLGPVELAQAAADLAEKHGAAIEIVAGQTLTSAYPCLAAVGAGSDRPARVVKMAWRGSKAQENAPLLSLVGKGVCFDTGGYDIKPASGMLRMKKDMGGAALMLALAHVIMAQDLPLRLELRIGCVENSISGHAMRPGDILTTRSGLTVEVGNTDAEGRLVLSDLLSEACESAPDWLLDAATLTGAARVALGPDLPALFCNDRNWSHLLLDAAENAGDAMWQLPLWHGYDAWLGRKNAHLGNVTDKPMAGAITAALFLQRFVEPPVKWAHIDTYAWNDSARPGRPEGGETLALRALVDATLRMINEYDVSGAA